LLFSFRLFTKVPFGVLPGLEGEKCLKISSWEEALQL